MGEVRVGSKEVQPRPKPLAQRRRTAVATGTVRRVESATLQSAWTASGAKIPGRMVAQEEEGVEVMTIIVAAGMGAAITEVAVMIIEAAVSGDDFCNELDG